VCVCMHVGCVWWARVGLTKHYRNNTELFAAPKTRRISKGMGRSSQLTHFRCMASTYLLCKLFANWDAAPLQSYVADNMLEKNVLVPNQAPGNPGMISKTAPMLTERIKA